MEIACIVRCIGVAVLVVSLQTGAQPPDGKGRPDQAGPSPFIRFPVPQRSVGVIRQTALKTFADLPSPRGKAASGEVIEISTPKAVGPSLANAKAEKLAQMSSAMPGEPPATERKAALRECGAR